MSLSLRVRLFLPSLSMCFHVSRSLLPVYVFPSIFFSRHHPLKMSRNCLHLICPQTPFRFHLRDSFSPGHHPHPGLGPSQTRGLPFARLALQGLSSVWTRHLEEGEGPEPPSTGPRGGEPPGLHGTNRLGALHSPLRHPVTAYDTDGANGSQCHPSLSQERLLPSRSDL